MAYHSPGRPEQIRKIAERQEIPPRYLEQILQKLRRAGIVKTARGAKGGYYLARQPSSITVGDVVMVTDGPTHLVACREGGDRNTICHRAPGCAVKPVWEEAGKRLTDYLNSVTIENLCENARSMGL
jgi:Rrf2 family protein